MLEIYYGDNRIKAEGAIKKTLGSGYEVIDGAELKTDDLPNIFMGTSLFTSERAILIKDLGENTEVWNKLINYIDTSNKVIIWEQKLDKRTTAYKELAKAGVKMVEFALTEAPEAREVFNILDTAWHDGKKAVLKLDKIEKTAAKTEKKPAVKKAAAKTAKATKPAAKKATTTKKPAAKKTSPKTKAASK